MNGEIYTLDERYCHQVLHQMTKQERREFFIRQTMKARGETYRSLARKWNKGRSPNSRERITAWGLNLAVKRATWTPLVVKILENGLRVSLVPFLYKPGEQIEERHGKR